MNNNGSQITVCLEKLMNDFQTFWIYINVRFSLSFTENLLTDFKKRSSFLKLTAWFSAGTNPGSSRKHSRKPSRSFLPVAVFNVERISRTGLRAEAATGPVRSGPIDPGSVQSFPGLTSLKEAEPESRDQPDGLTTRWRPHQFILVRLDFNCRFGASMFWSSGEDMMQVSFYFYLNFMKRWRKM